jgi:hypothetical protein
MRLRFILLRRGQRQKQVGTDAHKPRQYGSQGVGFRA